MPAAHASQFYVRLTKAIDPGRAGRLLLSAEGFDVFNTENYAG